MHRLSREASYVRTGRDRGDGDGGEPGRECSARSATGSGGVPRASSTLPLTNPALPRAARHEGEPLLGLLDDVAFDDDACWRRAACSSFAPMARATAGAKRATVAVECNDSPTAPLAPASGRLHFSGLERRRDARRALAQVHVRRVGLEPP